MAVVRCQMLVQFAQVQELVDATEKMVRRNVLFEVEGIEQRHSAGFLTSHRRVKSRFIDGKSVSQLQITEFNEFSAE